MGIRIQFLKGKRIPVRSVVDPDPDWIRVQSGPWTRIRNTDPDPGQESVEERTVKIGKKVKNFFFY